MRMYRKSSNITMVDIPERDAQATVVSWAEGRSESFLRLGRARIGYLKVILYKESPLMHGAACELLSTCEREHGGRH